MTIIKDFLVAKVDVDSVENDDFSWIASSDAPFEGIDITDLFEKYIDDVFEIYKSTYLKIEKQLYITEKANLIKYDRWVLFYENDKMVAISLYRHHDYGEKLGVTGTNESKKAKRALVSFHKKAFNLDNVFGEISPPLEKAIFADVPKVSVLKAKNILQKSIKPHKDGIHCYRIIKNLGSKRKVLVGKPTRS